MSRNQISKVLLPAVAMVIFASSLQAITLVASPTAITLPCDTVLGPIPVTVGITLSAAGGPFTTTVTSTAGTGLTSYVATLPTAKTVASATTAVNFTFSSNFAGCVYPTGAAAKTVNLVFTSTGTSPPVPITVVATIGAPTTVSGSALALSPAAATITCTRTTSDSPGSSATVNVTSPANLGTPFTLDATTTIPSPTGIFTVTNPASSVTLGGTPTAAGTALTVTPIGTCGNLPAGSTNYTVHLLNPPAVDKTFVVTVQVGSSPTLVANPTSIALTYTKGLAIYTALTSSLTNTGTVFVTVDPNSLPLWLNVTATTGVTPRTLSFVPTPGAETLTPGLYTATVRLKVSGALDATIPVTLRVNNDAAALSVSEGVARSANWTLGDSLPTFLITPVSSSSSIGYAVTTSGATGLNPQVSQNSGLALVNGNPIVVTFLNSVFSAALPGTDLIGHVILTASTTPPQVVDVTITVHIKAAGPSASSLSPSSVSTATSGSYTVNLLGSGFVASADPNIRTKVGVYNGTAIVSDFNVSGSVQNSTLIILTINVPSSTDVNLPFDKAAGGKVIIGVCNPQVGCATIPAAQQVTLTIAPGPIVQAVTSASSFLQATMPVLTSVAPYDILSIFGTAFCMSGTTGGCTGDKTILYGTTDAVNPLTLRYVTALSPDAAGATQRNLSVTFLAHGSSTVIGTAPLLFATNNQINIIVPAALKDYIGQTVDIVVNFGYMPAATMLKSPAYAVTVASTNPGIFTVAGSGQGDAAALMPVTAALVTPTAPAGVRATATSDIIALYVTGLGAPDSDGTAVWAALPTTPCMTVDTYWGLVNTAYAPTTALTSNDGLVIQSALYPALSMQPCMLPTDAITVKVGGIDAPVVFAGWVGDSVAGLYQINVTLPATTTAMTDTSLSSAAVGATARVMPIVVTTVFASITRTSQPTGVTLSVVRRPLVTLPTTLSGVRSAAWPTATTSNVVATDGAAAFTYTFSGQTVATGLTFGASDGTITGTATATPGTYTITVLTHEAGNVAADVTSTFTITIT